MIFVLIDVELRSHPKRELSLDDWARIKAEELIALSFEKATGDVYRYSTTQEEWIKQ